MLLKAEEGAGALGERVYILVDEGVAVHGEHAEILEGRADYGLGLGCGSRYRGGCGGWFDVTEWVGHWECDVGARRAVVVNSITSDGAALSLVEHHVAAFEFMDPAGVGPHFSTEMIEGVIVVGVLGALVIEVNLLVAVELAAKLVCHLGAGHSGPELVNQILNIFDLFVAVIDSVAVEENFVIVSYSYLAPVP